MDIMNKCGRPRVSRVLDGEYTDKKTYNNEYRKEHRYIFTINLSQDRDSDIITALETIAGGNRQAALKILIREALKQRDNLTRL